MLKSKSNHTTFSHLFVKESFRVVYHVALILRLEEAIHPH